MSPAPRLIDQPDMIGGCVLVRRRSLRDLPSAIWIAADLLRRADTGGRTIEDGGSPAECTYLLNDRETDALLGLIAAGARMLCQEIAEESDDEPGIAGVQ